MKVKVPNIILVPQILQLVLAVCVFLFTFCVEIGSLGALAFSNALNESAADFAYACFPLLVFSVFAFFSFIYTNSQHCSRSFAMEIAAAICLAVFLIIDPIVYFDVVVNLIAFILLELLFSGIEIVLCILLLFHLHGFNRYLSEQAENVPAVQASAAPSQVQPMPMAAPTQPMPSTQSKTSFAPAPNSEALKHPAPSPSTTPAATVAPDPGDGATKSYIVTGH